MRALHIVVPVSLLLGSFVACGGDDTTPPPAGAGGSGATGGSGGSTGGSGGSTADASVDTSTGGTAGSGGASGSGGTGGKGGAAGSATGGASGSTGTGGASGSGGTAGKGGAAGTAGTAGSGGSGGAAGTAGAGGTAGTAGAGGTAGSAGAGGTGGGGPSVSVLQHHNHANRDGVYVDSVITKAAAATMHVDTTFASATYAGMVTAQPLYLAGAGSVPDLVIIVTNQNHAIAFNATNGAKVWDQTLGTPLPVANLATLKAGCGSNISGQVGILGTPVIDGATRTIYLSSTQLSGSTAAHMAYALDADTGMTRTGWPVDVTAKAVPTGITINPLAESQRGALAFVGGRVVIPYGGYIGDCGAYHGWVASISAADPTQVTAFATRAIAGGIWAPSGVASDGTSVYFATGNTEAMANSFTPPAMYGDGESVFKLPPDLTRTMATTEYFVPTNWSALDQGDTDIGGTGPLLVDVAGATPSNLIVQFGKDGKAYLIDRNAMGGQSAPLASPTVATGTIINAAVSYKTATATYALFRASPSGCPSGSSGSMAAVKITPAAPPTAAIAWCGGAATKKSAAVTMADAAGTDTLVWIVGTDNKLRGYDGDTGTVVFNGGAAGDTLTATADFQTPIVANGRIFAASNTQVYAFKP